MDGTSYAHLLEEVVAWVVAFAIGKSKYFVILLTVRHVIIIC
jgi:hypothetical protein